MKAKKLSIFKFNADLHHHRKELMENVLHQFSFIEKLKLLFVCIFRETVILDEILYVCFSFPKGSALPNH